MIEDLGKAILQLKQVCSKHMLPLEDIGFWGDIIVNDDFVNPITTIQGVKINNRQYSEDNIGYAK